MRGHEFRADPDQLHPDRRRLQHLHGPAEAGELLGDGAGAGGGEPDADAAVVARALRHGVPAEADAEDAVDAERALSGFGAGEEVPDGPPAYVEFRIGDALDELGIIDRRYAAHPTAAPGGAVVHWHVDDVAAARERLLELGAAEHEPVVTREAGFVTDSVLDPFGNVLGIMYNPHYLEMLTR